MRKVHEATLLFESKAVYVTTAVSLNLYGGRTPMGLTVTAGALSLLSVAIGIVQFASAMPSIFNETRMSEGQEFSKDGGVTSAKKIRRKTYVKIGK